MTAKQMIWQLLAFIVGGLIYQGGRYALGLPPTWDTFVEITFAASMIWMALYAWRR